MSEQKKRTAAVLRLHAIASVLALWGTSAVAVEIDTGNPDLKVRWDNTLRYNLGWRVEKQDPRILANRSYDEGDSKFDKGSVVTNRLDLLSEFDVSWQNRFGARLVASGWYDNAYDDRTVTSPAPGGFATSYNNDKYNSKVSRYVNGPSAEFLDAFVWTNFNLGAVPVNVKLGRHAVIWGEGSVIGAHAISYSQAPIDGVKAVLSPGIETKELLLPINQLSFKAQLTSDLTLAGQYFLEWKPLRAPFGGTYLVGADTSPDVDRLAITPAAQGGVAAARVDPYVPGSRGNWGLSARWNVAPINSTIGAYYREFNDYAPENGIQFMSFTQLVPGNAATTVPTSFRFVYPRNVKQLSVSLARPIGPVSFGAELSYRKNGALNSTGSYNSPLQNTGARGDTWHAVANGVYLLPKTPLWDTGSLLVEAAYSRLDKVTANEALYKGEGNLLPMNAAGALACSKSGAAATVPGDRTDTCSSKQYAELAVAFSPTYLGVFPSWDLELPMFVGYGIKGTAPSASAGFEKLLRYSISAKMTYSSRHEFSLRYADIKVPTKYNPAGTAVIGGNSSGGTLGATDRGWVVFTYKTSF
jgi:Protein of unknown function (DUF1302)